MPAPEAADGGRPLDPFHHAPFPERAGGQRLGRPGTGWQPQYLTAYQEGRLIACAPLYAKGHSQGEYIFDHNWAHAYEQAGGHYYPKLQIAVPFTPATGRRFLVRPGYDGIGSFRVGAGGGAAGGGQQPVVAACDLLHRGRGRGWARKWA